MEVERMNGRVLVESGMGQLQVAVAGLGEGAGPGHLVPGSWASGHDGTLLQRSTSAGGSRRCHSRLVGTAGYPRTQWATLVRIVHCIVAGGTASRADGLTGWRVASKTGENLKARTAL